MRVSDHATAKARRPPTLKDFWPFAHPLMFGIPTPEILGLEVSNNRIGDAPVLVALLDNIKPTRRSHALA